MESMQANAKEYIDWALDQYLRPTLILLCSMLLFNLPTFLYKVRLLLTAIQYLIFCNDKKWKKPADPGSIFGPHLSSGKPVERRTIYFVRHGESTWNDTFNKGHHRSTLVFILGFLPGLVKAVLFELYLLLSGKVDR
jgi:prolipoprotein diacylglyceryltransferase